MNRSDCVLLFSFARSSTSCSFSPFCSFDTTLLPRFRSASVPKKNQCNNQAAATYIMTDTLICRLDVIEIFGLIFLTLNYMFYSRDFIRIILITNNYYFSTKCELFSPSLSRTHTLTLL